MDVLENEIEYATFLSSVADLEDIEKNNLDVFYGLKQITLKYGENLVFEKLTEGIKLTLPLSDFEYSFLRSVAKAGIRKAQAFLKKSDFKPESEIEAFNHLLATLGCSDLEEVEEIIGFYIKGGKRAGIIEFFAELHKDNELWALIKEVISIKSNTTFNDALDGCDDFFSHTGEVRYSIMDIYSFKKEIEGYSERSLKLLLDSEVKNQRLASHFFYTFFSFTGNSKIIEEVQRSYNTLSDFNEKNFASLALLSIGDSEAIKFINSNLNSYSIPLLLIKHAPFHKDNIHWKKVLNSLSAD